MWKAVSQEEAKAAEKQQLTPAGGLPAAKKATGSFPAAGLKTPSAGSSSAGGTGSGVRTPARGLPAALNERAVYMLDLARAELAASRLASAENNLRLAMTFDPSNKDCAALLERVKALRDDERKASAKP